MTDPTIILRMALHEVTGHDPGAATATEVLEAIERLSHPGRTIPTTEERRTNMSVRYRAGGVRAPGTDWASNVTGDCPHLHRTPEAAQACIDDMDRKIKRGHGPNAYCDRIVLVCDEHGHGAVPYMVDA